MPDQTASQPKGLAVKVTLPLVAAALVFTASAAASSPSTPWTTKDMKTAIRAIGYPRAHAKTLICHGQGTADTVGRFTSFRCVATYRRRPHRRVFYTAGQGEGGWLCAGKTLAGCVLLRHGFVTTSQVKTLPSLGAAADLAARGYMQNHYGGYQVTHLCEAASSSTWSCPFSQATVTITFRAVSGGYVTAGAAA